MTTALAANSAKEIVWAVQESALGTVMTSPAGDGVNATYPRLSQGAFGMNADDIQEDIVQGGGYGFLADSVSDHYECKGTLKINLYPRDFLFWMNFCTSRVDLTQMLPYPTDQLPGDLPSMSFYHNYRTASNTRIIERFAGTKCAAWTVEVSRRASAATLSMDLIACRCYPHAMDSGAAPSDFVYPADTDYPTGPFTFAMTGGNLIIGNGGTARVGYDSVSISGKNVLDSKWYETAHLQSLEFCGRMTTLDAELRLIASPDDKATYQAMTAVAAGVAFTTGGHTYTIGLNGKNLITKLPPDLPASGTFMRKLSLKNLYDTTALNDLQIAYA